VALGVIVAALTPFDAPAGIVLAVQGVVAVLAFTRARRRSAFLWAGVAAAFAAGAAYVVIQLLFVQALPVAELADPLRSGLVASFAGGLLAGPLALALRPLVERLIGDIPRSTLLEYAELEHPLLKQISVASPGTWQHSLAVANMAEMAASAIGANALLVRVGAYYHDLGKSLDPRHYIENLGPCDASPHDEISPIESARAIFAHVTEGVRVGRDKGLPEAIVDFMHMHHGDGVLEYFWGKCLEQGNPDGHTVDDFRYPGVRPQSKETAILAICDAVEAASRTIDASDPRAVETVVQRIVYGKLHLGQLDESDMTLADLKTVANSLTDVLRHARHSRIEYPWQREARAAEAAAGGIPDGPVPAPVPRAPAAPRTDTTRRFVIEHALDSADAPRPWWGAPRSTPRAATPVPEAPAPAAAANGGPPASEEAPPEGPIVTAAVPTQSMVPPRRR
jgi:cyclic-di-AMP phosphodiesterase PgpH